MLTEVMSDYFNKSQERSPLDIIVGTGIAQKPPITPMSFTWERVTDPDRLMKAYEFDSHIELSNFVGELLIFEQDFNHYAKMTIDFPKVVIEVYTHDVNAITELDTDYATKADQIRQDVSYYSEENDYEF
tara:strand:- start:1124 stop:1513 length:390 start_codon:yes stop_codon:yes gene_type:complete